MRISIADYFMGRDIRYASQLTPDIRARAAQTVERVNQLLARAELDGIEPARDQVTRTAVASGWRTPAINDATANSATGSNHLTGAAVDLQDDGDRHLARWCLANLDVLEEIGLWMERPQWTGGADPWVHLQIVPPKSGHRVYIPSSSPALAEALPGEIEAA